MAFGLRRDIPRQVGFGDGRINSGGNFRLGVVCRKRRREILISNNQFLIKIKTNDFCHLKFGISH